ncbi:MAG TPA: DUF4105 domain-containing protein [Gemmatimonadaceae bacterium]|nr:DUF4105 domain-containing protein [Gemmatimonadaceae bacterium]
MKARALISLLALSLSLGTMLDAQGVTQNPPSNAVVTPAAAEPGSNLTVYLLTFGWGDVVWERFGHNAIWIKDRTRGTDVTYNWGMFDFNQPHFLRRFLTGDTRYWMEAIDFAPMVRFYKERDRSILAQELNLTPAQRLKLQQFVQNNALPENKFYRYDYYRDNCSTRLRDALDHAVSGQLQLATVTRVTSGTYRSHTQRLMTGDIPLYTGVTLALGHPADKLISVWDEMFLPVRMANDVRSVSIPDSTGARIPLVRSEMAIFTAGRSPEPAAPPNYFPWYVAFGILLAGVVIALVRSAEGGNRIAFFAATAIATLWSLIAGLAGTALVFAWLFTKHYFMSRNENLMHFDPLLLALAILVPLSVYGLRGVSKALKLSGFVAALSLFGFVLQGIRFFDQKNGEIIALALPLNLAVWWTVHRLTHYKRTSLPSSAAL